MASLIIAALDYLEYKEDAKLYSDTLKIYEWIEENMLRDGEYTYVLGSTGQTVIGECNDMLYWGNWNQGRDPAEVTVGPEYGVHPYKMEEGGYCSVFLGGMFGMGAIHARLYKLTGDKDYLERALETVRAINDNPSIIKKGVYRNLGDAWTNAGFMRQWVTEVLTLPGVYDSDFEILESTAESIYKKARTEDGYYSAAWSGPADDTNKWGLIGWTSETLMVNATDIHMIFAAALGVSVRSENTK